MNNTSTGYSNQTARSFPCDKCGGPLNEPKPGQNFVTCSYCGSKNIITFVNDRKVICPKCHLASTLNFSPDINDPRISFILKRDGYWAPSLPRIPLQDYPLDSPISGGKSWAWIFIGVFVVLVSFIIQRAYDQAGTGPFAGLICGIPAFALIIFGVAKVILERNERKGKIVAQQLAIADWKYKKQVYDEDLLIYNQKLADYVIFKKIWKKIYYCERDDVFFDPDYPDKFVEINDLGKFLGFLLEEQKKLEIGPIKETEFNISK